MNRTASTRVLIVAAGIVFVLLLAAIGYRFVNRSVPVLRVGVEAGALITEPIIGSREISDAAVIYTIDANGDGGGDAYTVIDPADLVNRVALVAIPAGVPITENMLRDDTVSDPRFPAALPEDAVRIKYYVQTDLRRSSGGLVRPGDLVNVLVADERSGSSNWVLQRVRVVGALTEAGAPVIFANNSSVTDARGRFAVAGYLLSLLPEQVPLVARYPATSISLLLVTDKTDLLPGVPVGIDGVSQPEPSVTPAPSVIPVP
jgi:hypothetical protein